MLIKVGHVGKYYSPFKGGIENFTKDLVDNRVYALNVKPVLIVHQEEPGVASNTSFTQGVKVRKVSIMGKLLYSPIAPTFLRELFTFIKEEDLDVIHIHSPNVSAFLLLLISSAKKIPWVVHWHSDVVGAKPDWRIRSLYPIYRIFERAILKRASQIIVTSPNYLAASRALKPYVEKCSIIPLGLSSPALQPNVLTSQKRADGLKLLIVGRLTYYKGHNQLINALAKCPNVQLDIVGTGDLEAALTKQCDELDVTSRVRFHGFLDDEELARLYITCDLLCLPSIEKTEAFGLVILEAARLGKPALVTNVHGSGMSWVVEHKKTGLVVDANSVDALVEAITYAENNKELLIQYGQAARKKFESQFHMDQIALKIVGLYRQVTKP